MAAPSEGYFSDRGLPAPGFVLNRRYRIESLIGEGGMGAVFAARDLERHEDVAVKVLLPEQLDQRESTKRFTREARAAQAIDSAHVARVIDAGELTHGMPFMILELLVGQSLSALIQDRAPFQTTEAVDYLLQTCEGLACAHALGIIHRDLKPANLYLVDQPDTPPLLKVLDFGIAKATMRLDTHTEGVSLTESSSTLGSPEYMSPEQLRNSKNVGIGTDIWSLGLILHKMLAGKPAFEAETVGEHFAMIVSDDPTPLREHCPDAPVELERAILCCLRKRAAHRYQDVAQLAEAIGPYGPAGSAERVTRIRAILDAAGASASSGPPSESAASLDGEMAASRQHREASDSIDSDRTAGRRAPSRTAAVGRARTSRLLTVAIALGAAGVGVGGYRWLQSATNAESIAVDADTAPSAQLLEPDAPSAPVDPPDRSAAPAATTTSVSIQLEIDPAHARIELDGEATSDNPLVLPRSDRTYTLVASASGYRTERREVSATHDTTVEIHLARPSPAGPAAAPPARSPSKSPIAPPTATAEADPPTPTTSAPRVKHKGPMVDSL